MHLCLLVETYILFMLNIVRQDLITIFVESMKLPSILLCVWGYKLECTWFDIKKFMFSWPKKGASMSYGGFKDRLYITHVLSEVFMVF